MFETCARGPWNMESAARFIRDRAPLEIQVGKMNFIEFYPSRLYHWEIMGVDSAFTECFTDSRLPLRSLTRAWNHVEHGWCGGGRKQTSVLRGKSLQILEANINKNWYWIDQLFFRRNHMAFGFWLSVGWRISNSVQLVGSKSEGGVSPMCLKIFLPICAGGGHPGRAGGKTEEDPREAGVQDDGVVLLEGTRLGHFRETFLSCCWFLHFFWNVLIKDPGSVSLSW